MKKKFITKLILSGAALAASAATLVSTTYAWYVQNTQVTATGVSGAVKDDEASSIFISKNFTFATRTTTTQWLRTVAFEAGDKDVAYNGASILPGATVKGINKVYDGGLDPITLNAASNGSFVYADNSTIIKNQTTDVYKAESRVIEFSLYVQSNVDNTTIRPYVILENATTSGDAKPQTAYKAVALATGSVNQGDHFWIDAAQALRMQVDVSQEGDNAWPTTPTSSTIYDMLSVAKKDYNQDSDHPYTYRAYQPVTTISGLTNTTIITEADLAAESTQTIGTESVKLRGANKYYYDIMGNVPAAGVVEKATPYKVNNALATNINQQTLAKDKVYKFTFRIWLEGTDPACFDSCMKQKFNFTINFDVEAPEQQANQQQNP